MDAGSTAGDVLEHHAILIEHGVIQTIDTWASLRHLPEDRDIHVVDASQYTVMPGLIDAHTHVVHSGDPHDGWHAAHVSELTATTALKAARSAAAQLDAGVTTIRDVAAPDWVDVALRDAINAGWHRGARMLVAGHGITSPGGHMDARKFVRPGIAESAIGTLGVVARSADEARAAAWEQLARGVDLIKINATLSEYVRASGGQCSPELTLEMMQAVCEVAHHTGRKVAAHCHGGIGVTWALEAGVDTFEHGRFLTDEMLATMAATKRFLVPTLSPEAQRRDAGDPPTDAASQRWYSQAEDTIYKTVANAHAHGVTIVAGTDAGMPHVYHGSLAYEMRQLAQAGLSNYQAVEAGTCNAAAALGISERIGSIAAGKEADFLLVNGQPERDVGVLEQRSHTPDSLGIVSVWQLGTCLASYHEATTT
jgi:imidazolonepropionase-like amidohydrolase